MADVDVSVIIVNYHTFDLTCNCIQSVEDRTKGTSYEIILVDNGSTKMEEMEFGKRFPRITYINTSENMGFSRANNVGIKRARGIYVLLLNSDTILVNDAVTIAKEVLENDTTIGVVSGQLLNPDGSVQPVAGKFPSLKNLLLDLFRVSRFYDREQRSKFYLGTEWNYDQAGEVDWVWGAFFMFRRLSLNEFPGNKLHETFFMYYEDVQWCYHFKTILKKKVVYAPGPKAIHYLGKSDKNAEDRDAKYFSSMLPNEHAWMTQTRGRLYTFSYYLAKTLYYLSLRRSADVSKANIYRRYILKK
ncbi:MAG TPA: glycosyltransferase family 2 protein [Cyclobacteriaceae bacterium]|nr:glycosyltransferase family 2 protein [Cyclobacteriaceae bacterium]